MRTRRRCYSDSVSSSSACSSSKRKRNIKDLQEADLKKTIIPAKSQSEEERKQKQIQIQTTTLSINMSCEQQTQLLVQTEEPINNIFPHAKEYFDLLEEVCNKDDHSLGSPCDENFWPKFAWELSQRRHMHISSLLCESFCCRMYRLYRASKNPATDMQKLDKWKLRKYLQILENIFGEHGHKFECVPDTPPSSSSIKRPYHVGGTSFYTAHGSTLSPTEDVAIQQILDDMVNTGQLNIVDLNFAQDWLSQSEWAAGAFRRAGDPDSRKKMIRDAQEEIGDVWVDKRLKRA